MMNGRALRVGGPVGVGWERFGALADTLACPFGVSQTQTAVSPGRENDCGVVVVNYLLHLRLLTIFAIVSL
jgi:hypothetical protein